MSLGDLARLLLRRWFVLVLGAGLCLILGSEAAQRTPPRQEMTASIVLLPPIGRESTGPNPYLALGGLEGVADVVARRVLSDDVQQRLVDAGVESVAVERDTGAAAPIVVSTVVARDRDDAKAGIDLLIAAVPRALSLLQNGAGVEPEDLITTRVLAVPEEPTTIRTPQIRAVLVAVAVGLLVAIGVAVLLDLLLARSRRRAPAVVAARATVTARAAQRAGGAPVDEVAQGAQQVRDPDRRPAGSRS